MKKPFILLAAVALLVGTAATGRAAPLYNFSTIDFPTAAFTSANGINSAGEIVGAADGADPSAFGVDHLSGRVKTPPDPDDLA
jgi:hypothetical protein